MASRLKEIIPLAEQTTKELSSNPEKWASFLKTAGWNYKYSFHDQVLIYAQRPEATACAELQLWNSRFRRWVSKGAKGIALIDDTQEKLKLRYVFDIADTNSFYGHEVHLWALQEKYQESITEALENSFGEIDTKDMPSALLSAAKNAAEDNYNDYLSELLYAKENSFLEELDDLNIQVMFRQLLENSIGYMLLVRCGYQPLEYFSAEDFRSITQFNTPSVITIMGTASSDISEMVLREIESTVKAIEKAEKTQGQKFAKDRNNDDNEIKTAEAESEKERGEENGNHIQTDGRLSAAGTDIAGGTAEHREIRYAAEDVPEEPPESILLHTDDNRQADGALGGNRASGAEPDGTGDKTDGTAGRRDGGTESRESNDVDRSEKQHPSSGRRTDSAGVHLQLNTDIGGNEDKKALPPFLSEELIEELLCNDRFMKKKHGEVIQYFKENASSEKRASFVKEAYNDEYTELVVLNERRVGYKKQETGLCMWEGSYIARKSESVFSWDIVQEFVAHLIERNLYFAVQPLPVLKSVTEQLSLFDENNLGVTKEESAPKFLVSQQVIDEILASGGNDKDSRLRICAWFKKNKPLEANAAFLQKEFGRDGKGFYIGDAQITARYGTEGIRIAYGRTAENTSDSLVLTWEQAAERIETLLLTGQYMPQEELDKVDDWEREDIAKRLWNLYRDEFGNIPSERKIIPKASSYPEDVRQIASMLSETKEIEKIANNIHELIPMLEQYPPRFRIYHDLLEVHTAATDLLLPQIAYRAQEGFTFSETRRYISDDEIDSLLRSRGGNMEGGKFRIYTFFQNEHTEKEKADFLKEEYGTGGYSGGGDSSWHDSKGLTYSRGDIGKPYDKVVLTWNKVANRITKLIEEKSYLSQKEKDFFPEYEKNVLCREIYSFYYNQPAEIPRPYPRGADYESGIKTIRLQLEEEQAVQDILKGMTAVLDSTAQFDKAYPAMQKAFEDLSDYHNGTYSLIKKQGELLHQTEENQKDNGNILPSEPNEGIEELVQEQEVEMPPPLSAEKNEAEELPQAEKRNYRITDDSLGVGGAKTKCRNNLEAIRTLRTIEEEKRLATAEEQEILSRYVGWGGLPQAFDENNSVWANEFQELKELLTPEEYTSARASTLNAHYTSPLVIRAIYQAIEHMGFRKGNILEPSCGIGNFFGMLPESMQESKLFGVELDSITGRIAKQLYQKNNIAVCGFEETELPDSFFDIAVGNVPFGSYKVQDKKYDRYNFFIHDYFFAKTIDKVRPGGVIAFITSKGTMDKKNPAVRKYIAQRAELLGAVRLPNTAFKANAGTEVTTDILFLQKRDRIVDIEPDWVHLGQTEQGIPVNQYFLEHPEMLLGEMTFDDRLYGNETETTCNPFPDVDLGELLNAAIAHINGEVTSYAFDEILDEEQDLSIPADPNVRNFSYAIVDGKIYYRENSRMNPVNLSVTAENRIRGMIAIRDSARRLIAYQTEEYSDSAILEEQKTLNHLYDTFTGQYGLLNSRGNHMVFSQDSCYPLLCSLEILDEQGQLKRKADMFSKRTIKPNVKVERVDSASEALAVSLAERACVDMSFMSRLTGKEEDVLASELRGIVFRDFASLSKNEYIYQTADEFLSGNVREKLKKYEYMLSVLPEDAVHREVIERNIEALKQVQPVDLKASQISARLGSAWIPQDVVQQFVYELLDTGYYSKNRIKVLYSKQTGEWNISGKSYDKGNVKSESTYGTKRINAYRIIEETLNQRDVRVFDKFTDENGNEKRVLNKKETAIAQSKQEVIKQAFKDWVWKEAKRRERLTVIYNERFNSIRPREYDGSHLRFSGMNPEITLRKHQIDAIAHIIYGGNTLLAHEVGAGKTFEMVAAAQESKRLGLCNKTLVVVPNHITEQFGAEWLQLYPAANILIATKKDFETKNRKKFCGRIATGDYDAVIIGHSQLEKIPISIERQQRLLEQQIEEIMEGIREAKAAKSENYTIKQMERNKKALTAKLKKLNDQSRKDDLVTFEELGVDRIMVDEAHYFKNLFLVSKMRNVSGIAQTEAQKSTDLFMKCRYLDEITNGRGIVFATGTPISNSMVELYTMQRYLQYETLVKMELQHFDAWASTFGETVTAIELAPEGTGYRAKTRFSKFYNLPELMSTFKCVADIQTADMLNLPVPKVKYHVEVIKPTELQKEMVASLAERAEAIRAGSVDPTVDNMLKITNDGRKLALDQRLINPILPNDEKNKISVCANNIFRIWEETQEQCSAQLVFCDLSTPTGKSTIGMKEIKDGSFEMDYTQFSNAYEDLKKKLMDKGIPVNEIAFIHEANTETQKKEMFAKVRHGDIRVLIGSTQKMGAGTNVRVTRSQLKRLRSS